MVNWFKRKKEIDIETDINVLYSPLKGNLVDIKNVNDKTFSSGMMGHGLAIFPETNMVSSPIDGEVMMIFPTKHAIGIKAKNGCDVIIHIGIDTVELKGECFDCKVKVGDQVKVGQDLVDVQMSKVKAKGYDTVTMIVITNSDDYDISQISSQRDVQRSDKLLRIVGKETSVENSKIT